MVSALLFGGRLRWLPATWQAGKITPIICRETVIELMRVLDKPRFRLNAMQREEALSRYLLHTEEHILPEPRPLLPAACRDVDDAVFLHLALASSADCLVTGDGDLLSLRSAVPVRIVTISELQAMQN